MYVCSHISDYAYVRARWYMYLINTSSYVELKAVWSNRILLRGTEGALIKPYSTTWSWRRSDQTVRPLSLENWSARMCPGVGVTWVYKGAKWEWRQKALSDSRDTRHKDHGSPARRATLPSLRQSYTRRREEAHISRGSGQRSRWPDGSSEVG